MVTVEKRSSYHRAKISENSRVLKQRKVFRRKMWRCQGTLGRQRRFVWKGALGREICRAQKAIILQPEGRGRVQVILSGHRGITGDGKRSDKVLDNARKVLSGSDFFCK